MALSLHVAVMLACLLLLLSSRIAVEAKKPTKCYPRPEARFFDLSCGFVVTGQVGSASACNAFCQGKEDWVYPPREIDFYSFSVATGNCKCLTLCDQYTTSPGGETYVNGKTDCLPTEPTDCDPEPQYAQCVASDSGVVVHLDQVDTGNFTLCCRYYLNSKECEGCKFFSYDNADGACKCLTECSQFDTANSPNYNGIIECPEGEGEPHFVGAKGTHYDFNGEIDKAFCLFTDRNLHMNGLFEGFTRNRRLRTWIKNLHISWRDQDNVAHEVHMLARRGVDEKRGNQGFIDRLAVDGNDVPVPRQVGEKVSGEGGLVMVLKDSGAIVKRSLRHGKAYALDRDTFSLDIDGLASFEISVNPDHAALRGPNDAAVHFNLVFLPGYLEGAVKGSWPSAGDRLVAIDKKRYHNFGTI